MGILTLIAEEEKWLGIILDADLLMRIFTSVVLEEKKLAFVIDNNLLMAILTLIINKKKHWVLSMVTIFLLECLR